MAQSELRRVTDRRPRRSARAGLDRGPPADAGELLDRVAQGEADYTIVDSNLFAIFQRFHPELPSPST